MVKYCVANEYPINRNTNRNACAFAAKNGHLEVLKYFREEAKAPWDSHAVREAHYYDHTECLQYCLDNNCPLPEGWSYANGELQTVPDHSELELEDVFEWW